MSSTTANEFGPELRDSLRIIKKDRNRKKALAFGGLIVALLALFGLTVLMYGSTPSDQSEGVIGPQTFEAFD